MNRASLLDLLHRVSRLAADNPEILELDLNPVVAFPGTKPALVLDARVRIGVPGGKSTPGTAPDGKKKDVPAGVPAASATSR